MIYFIQQQKNAFVKMMVSNFAGLEKGGDEITKDITKNTERINKIPDGFGKEDFDELEQKTLEKKSKIIEETQQEIAGVKKDVQYGEINQKEAGDDVGASATVNLQINQTTTLGFTGSVGELEKRGKERGNKEPGDKENGEKEKGDE